MTLDEYQAAIVGFDTNTSRHYDLRDGTYVDKILGLVGESGELADKYKKIIRDKGSVIGPADREELLKELGDVLWYVATLARYLDSSLDDVASQNVAKLSDRQQRNLIKGEGDNR